MNPPLFLWKNKIFKSEILILHYFIVSGLAHNFNQPLNPATTNVLLLPRPSASILWSEETLYMPLTFFSSQFSEKAKRTLICFKSLYVINFLLHSHLLEQP